MKILITDDHPLFRDGLRYVLQPLDEDLTIFEAGNFDETVGIATAHPDLDVVLLDLAMGGTHGLAALQRLRGRFPALPVVIISASEDGDTMRRALDLGAQGFIPKSSSSSVMLGALRLVLAGGIYLPPAFLAEVKTIPARDKKDFDAPSPARGSVSSPPGPAHGLTLRQLEVLSLVCKGFANKEICNLLGLSEGTVKIHVTAILKALNVTNRTRAVIVARELGLFEHA